MSEKVLKIISILLILGSVGVLWLAQQSEFLLGALLALFMVLYGSYLILNSWINRPMDAELDPYDLMSQKQRSEIRARALRKKIKIVKK